MRKYSIRVIFLVTLKRSNLEYLRALHFCSCMLKHLFFISVSIYTRDKSAIIHNYTFPKKLRHALTQNTCSLLYHPNQNSTYILYSAWGKACQINSALFALEHSELQYSSALCRPIYFMVSNLICHSEEMFALQSECFEISTKFNSQFVDFMDLNLLL